MSDISFVPLSWIKTEVDFALGHARDKLDRFRTRPEDFDLLEQSRHHVHEATGAIRVVGLDGLACFSGELEALLESLYRHSAAPLPQTVTLLERALLALTQFLDDLQRGKHYVPLNLFPLYRELRSARGGAPARHADLFYPVLDVELPHLTLPPGVMAQGIPGFLRGRAASFQRALVETLRAPTDMRVYAGMRGALLALSAALPQAGGRGLSWVGAGYVEGLGLRAILFDSDARHLLARIEQTLRRLVGGETPDTAPLARELLYSIAVSAREDGLIGDIKRRYRVAEHLPDTNLIEYDDETLRPLLRQANESIAAAKAAWARAIAGDPASFAVFRGHLASTARTLVELGLPALGRVSEAIEGVSSRMTTVHAERRNQIALDMATTLLLLEKAVAGFPEVGAELTRQIEAMGERLQSLHAGTAELTDNKLAAQLDAASRKAEERLVIAQVEREVRANLGQAETVLDAFFRDFAKRGTLPGLARLLSQARGALEMLELRTASRLVDACRGTIERLAVSTHDPEPPELEALAQGFSALGAVVDAIRDDAQFPQAVVNEALGQLETIEAAIAAQTAQLAAVPAVVEAAPGPDRAAITMPRTVRTELVDILLVEAEEILQQVRTELGKCRAQPDDLVALTAIRRGFHTLKGSGRMVGLADFAEAAWQVENLLNEWLQHSYPVITELAAFVDGAVAQFHDWVVALRSAGEPEIRGDVFAEAAPALLAAGAAAERHAPPVAQVVVLRRPVAPAAVEETAQIGPVELSEALFAIYREEAAQHAAALEQGCTQYLATGSVSVDFMRAAHTLASSSATAGFATIGELAEALEAVLRELQQAEPASASATVRDAVARLVAMVGEVGARRFPAAAEQLVAALRQECSALSAAAARAAAAPVAPAPVVDADLLRVFLEEAGDLVPQIGERLRAWQASPADGELQAAVQRALHTLKGSARAAGAMQTGELAHGMESMVASAVARGQAARSFFEGILADFDRLAESVEGLQPRPAAAVPAAAEPDVAGLMLRVRSGAVDRLVNNSGEISISRSRIEAELASIKRSLSDLVDSVERLRSQVRETEIQAESQLQSRMSLVREHGEAFDPLEFDRYTRLQELTRLMLESLYDVTAVQQSLAKSADEAETSLRQQARLNRELHEELMRVRTVPFASQEDRLYRVVRQTAQDCGKKARLIIRGGEVEVDRSIIEKVGAPIEHMLRNAVVHGLESPEERVRVGKPEQGTVTLDVRQEGNEVIIDIADDGTGLNLPAIIARARRNGIVAQSHEPGPVEAAELIFAPGLSTADELTAAAGRGVGLDVVRNEITELGGRVEVFNSPGRGTRFTVSLPLTLAVVQALLVRSHRSVFAIPATLVQHVDDLKPIAREALLAEGGIDWQGERYPLHYLPWLLGETHHAPDPNAHSGLVLLKGGLGRVALLADGIAGESEVVVKAVGPQLARLPWVSGATVLSTGEVVLIVNPLPLSQRQPQMQAAEVATVAAAEERDEGPLVMVVDDSLTVRKITGRLLEREGYRVTTAKDGVDALDQMVETLPHLMLVDLEMPRMDGFDLVRNLRGAMRTRGIPVIVITSRTAEKHRELALSLGANAFLGKPYKEDELLAYIARLLRGEPIPADPLAETIVSTAPPPNAPWPRGVQ